MPAAAEPTYDFDIFVIGGGSGGLALAKEAASLKAKVGLADFVKPSPKGTTWGIGGTCVNVGCIPKKLMHYAALCGETFEDEREAGWNLPERVSHDWARMKANVARHIKSLNWGYLKQLETQKIAYFNALATFIDSHTIQVTRTHLTAVAERSGREKSDGERVRDRGGRSAELRRHQRSEGVRHLQR